jgi:osmotically-inducible protein OsmY
VDSDEVDVSVSGGVATLTGTVDTWNERAWAEENAREGYRSCRC